MRIPGWAYLLVGIIVSVTSNRVREVTENQGMALFFYLGIVMIVIGVAKVLIRFIIKEDEQTIQEETKRVIKCPKCGVKHYMTSNYCHMCGTELK